MDFNGMTQDSLAPTSLMTSQQVQLLLLTLWLFTTFALLFLVWMRYPGNHGAGYHAFLVAYLGGLVVSIYATAARSSKVALVFAMLNVVSIVGVIFLNRANVFLTYSQWVERGMPGWGMF